MLAGRGDPQPIAAEQRRVELARPASLEGCASRDAEVNLAGDEPRDALFGAEPPDGDGDVWVLAPQRRKGRRQQIARHRLGAPDDDAFGRRDVRPHRARELDELGADAPHACAERRQTKLAPAPLNERPAGVTGERLHASAEDARVEAELARGALEGAGAGDLDFSRQHTERSSVLDEIPRKTRPRYVGCNHAEPA